MALTPIEYTGLQDAFDFFNRVLFDGAVQECFFTYQRKANSVGYFSPDRFSGRVEKFGRHELALNPDAFIAQTDEQICQTLVHEMCHGWQQHCGTPPARGYHDKEWAAKMKSIGLQPSSTGGVDGKETGQHMSDYIIQGGPFSQAYANLAATGWKLNLQSAPRPAAKGTPNSKTKFTCKACGQNAWGKPDLKILCQPCDIPMLDKRLLAAADAPVPQSYEPKPPELVKRKRGRPKGSKNKPKATVAAIQSYVQQPTEPRQSKFGGAPPRKY